MRTDKHLYTLLQTVPEWFTDLTGIPLPPGYEFSPVGCATSFRRARETIARCRTFAFAPQKDVAQISLKPEAQDFY